MHAEFVGKPMVTQATAQCEIPQGRSHPPLHLGGAHPTSVSRYMDIAAGESGRYRTSRLSAPRVNSSGPQKPPMLARPPHSKRFSGLRARPKRRRQAGSEKWTLPQSPLSAARVNSSGPHELPMPARPPRRKPFSDLHARAIRPRQAGGKKRPRRGPWVNIARPTIETMVPAGWIV